MSLIYGVSRQSRAYTVKSLCNITTMGDSLFVLNVQKKIKILKIVETCHNLCNKETISKSLSYTLACYLHNQQI